MEQIYPLHEENIKQFCGMSVCVVTHDGKRHVGVLSRCHEGKIMLNERPESTVNATVGIQQGKVTKVTNQKSKKQKKGKTTAESKPKETAQTQAYYPYDPYYGDAYGYGSYGFGFGESLAFDLASIAFLFLLI
ncbi:hypothetical protein GZH47_21725 [Paenibacillus rhizovicinus]|uniref:Uncharacterized protein n=1 Tax=Paenibacillus rhizovicinus TaxID=2704463 RepID=A0A6C0P3X9_9BACL|nr:hypothetical protein [Paenibacillus rhizovicinus]QHW33145.1 hypothetical protein GZH47_21725 [Paenibacillus rhizovicinus]